MTDTVLKFLRLFGFNRAIGYGALTRVWGALAGPVTILIIATRFSKVQQGYFYTFSSLLAMQIFFELGLLTVMSQFASHEFAQLTWGEGGTVRGEPVQRERFLDLLYKGFTWYAAAAVLLACALVPAGLYFFTHNQSGPVDFAWRLPWLLAVLCVAGNLLVIPFNAVITGSGDVAVINQQQMVGGMIGSLLSWLVIGLGGGLYAIPVVSSGTIVIAVYYLFKRKPGLIEYVWLRFKRKIECTHRVSWRGEVWPMQWKIALSWISGYFIFQLFTPVLFHYHGAIVAGQMGMTLSAGNALLGICLTWMNASNPELGKLIAHSKWNSLDGLFFRILRQSLFIACVGAAAGWSMIYLLQNSYENIGSRFLPAPQSAVLIATVVVVVAIYDFATYMRAHKREPLMVVSLVTALLQATATVVLGRYYSSNGIVLSYFFINAFVCLPVIMVIWSRFRIKWHSGT